MNSVPLQFSGITFFADVPQFRGSDGVSFFGGLVTTVLVGIFLSLAVISLGFYLVRRSKTQLASSSVQWSAFFFGSACICAMTFMVACGLYSTQDVGRGDPTPVVHIVAAVVVLAGGPSALIGFGFFCFKKPSTSAAQRQSHLGQIREGEAPAEPVFTGQSARQETRPATCGTDSQFSERPLEGGKGAARPLFAILVVVVLIVVVLIVPRLFR